MKFIYILVMVSSMLFSMEKQIILGSYSVESNGLAAVKTLQEQIENDEKLKTILAKNSVQVMSTTISGYTVVSANIFSSYSSLLPAMKVLKTYYGDAFVLKYPTKGFLGRETLKEVEQKAQEEQRVIEKEQKALEVLDEQLQSDAQANAEAKRLEDLAKKTMIIEELEEELIEPEVSEATEVTTMTSDVENTSMEDNSLEADSSLPMQTYYLLSALALLVLLIGGFIIYKKTVKEDEEH